MRLIDADSLNREDLCDVCNSADCANCFSNDAFEEWIQMQPTAYDIDKVVEQLDKLQASETPEWNDGYYSAIYEAISIVKGGVV